MFKEGIMDPVTWIMIIQMVLAAASAAKQASVQKKAAKRQAELANKQAREAWEAQEKAEKNRKDQLKKNLAKRRARMGAAGLSSTDGSAGAIIQEMRNDAAEDIYTSYNQTKNNVNASLASAQANLLEQSNAANRKLYQQAGESLGAIGGSFFDDDTTKTTSGTGSGGDKKTMSEKGEEIGGMLGGLMG